MQIKLTLLLTSIVIGSYSIAQVTNKFKAVDYSNMYGIYQNEEIGKLTVTKVLTCDTIKKLQLIVQIEDSKEFKSGYIYYLDCYFDSNEQLIASIYAYNGSVIQERIAGYFLNNSFFLIFNEEEGSFEYKFEKVENNQHLYF